MVADIILVIITLCTLRHGSAAGVAMNSIRVRKRRSLSDIMLWNGACVHVVLNDRRSRVGVLNRGAVLCVRIDLTVAQSRHPTYEYCLARAITIMNSLQLFLNLGGVSSVSFHISLVRSDVASDRDERDCGMACRVRSSVRRWS